ncbi:MAG: hypothetical protein VKQ33_11375, partial [Candidatus Sericytochromatia bacterium]|nr:hypothetical protein [Candidatus Sericytochromatia bacterium]
IFTDVWAAQLGFTDRRYTLQEVSDKFYALMREHPFRLPDRFLFLTRTAASMEGVVYRADPSFKFLPVALPFFAKLVLRRVDMENPWIIQELMRAASSGGMVDRLGSLVGMAVADEPEAMTELALGLVDVVAHPRAGALRRELKERLLAGGLEGLQDALPPGFVPGKPFLGKVEDFLASQTGAALVLEVLEDPRFPALVGRLAARSKPLPALELNWPRLLAAWFPTHAERARVAAVVHRMLFSESSPWHQILTAPPLREALHQWQELRRRPYEAITRAIDALAARDPIAHRTRHLLDTLVQRLAGLG